MSAIEWSEALEVGHGAMDATHREFVEYLNRVAEADDGSVLQHLDAFIAHTETHFGQEEAWMEARAFGPRGCHGVEHQNVLEVAREVRRRVAAGELHYGRTLAQALAEWFPVHATTMDAALALFMEGGAAPACGEPAPGCAAHAADEH
jgi:hemerythrin